MPLPSGTASNLVVTKLSQNSFSLSAKLLLQSLGGSSMESHWISMNSNENPRARVDSPNWTYWDKHIHMHTHWNKRWKVRETLQLSTLAVNPKEGRIESQVSRLHQPVLDLGRLKPGGSLSAYLNTVHFVENFSDNGHSHSRVPGNHHSNSRSKIKLKL